MLARRYSIRPTAKLIPLPAKYFLNSEHLIRDKIGVRLALTLNRFALERQLLAHPKMKLHYPHYRLRVVYELRCHKSAAKIPRIIGSGTAADSIMKLSGYSRTDDLSRYKHREIIQRDLSAMANLSELRCTARPGINEMHNGGKLG